MQELLHVIEEGLIGERSIPNQLRNHRRFDRKQFDNVVEAIGEARRNTEGDEWVPKRLALCFVDISNHFYVDRNHFEEHEVKQIEDAGLKLSELANQLFS